MKRLLPLALVLLASAAHAETKLRLPLNDCDTATKCYGTNKCYVTAYFDLNDTSGALADWGCGQSTYDGHKGTDYGIGGFPVMDSGSRPIVAGAEGTVIARQDGLFDRQTDFSACPSPGNYVALKHADGKVSVYLHMKKGTVAVQQGDSVKCGQLLGYVGSSGCSTGPHVHLEVDLNGSAFAGADDPYAAKSGCGGPLSYFVDQGTYCGLPSACCQSGCNGTTTDNAVFVSETVPDDSHFAPGAAIAKTWTLKNTGTSSWTKAAGFSWVFDGGDAMAAPATVALGASETVASGASKIWSVAMKAPATPGTYRGYWRMEHAGAKFGDRVWVQIIVDPPAGTKDYDGDGHDSVSAGGDDCNDTDKDIHPGHEELCDNKDNDCDGKVDDGVTRSCTSSCGAGTQACVDGMFQACIAAQPVDEICNGKDDDCDGVVDNDAPCPSGQTCTNGACVGPGGSTTPPPSTGGTEPVPSGGCGCSTAGSVPLAALFGLLFPALRRRRS